MTRLVTTFKFSGLVAILAIFIFLTGCKKEDQTKININTETLEALTDGNFETVMWHVKAFHPKGVLLDVKAVDADGHTYEVKAIQDSDQTSIMDIKAFVNEKILPVKILVSSDKYMPVKAIDADGTIIDVKAFTPDGKKLDVKGVRLAGNIVHICAIDDDGKFYNIEAISPKGWINDVKGVKMLKTPVEASVNGVDIFAHIKAIPQQN